MHSPSAKNTAAKTVQPILIKKSSQNQTGDAPSSEFSDSYTDWQIVDNNKRVRSPNQNSSPKSKKPTDQNIFISSNRYSPIAPQEDEHMNVDANLNNSATNNTEKISLPPPIFIQTQLNYNNFCQKIKQLTNNSTFECKSSSKSLKLQLNNSDSYRSVVKYLQENNVSFHSYQSKENKPFRIVIRNLHPSTDISFIKDELLALGFNSRNITNVLHRSTKSPLPIFFIDLEPDQNNSEIFKLSSLCYSKIKVEAPHARKEIPQCLRCQTYGHTRSYCHHPPRCVRCGSDHESAHCTKEKSEPAKCALCSGPHPANYKGCDIHKELQKKRKIQHTNPWFKNSQNQTNAHYVNENVIINNSNYPPLPQNKPNSNNISQKENSASEEKFINLTGQLSSFINDLKSLINPLISLLTSVIEKLLQNGK